MSAVAITSKTQEAVDRFYLQQGPCCAGCDWWFHSSSVIGECRKSAPVSAAERYSIVRMDWTTYRLTEPEAGHILTNREHHCGDFKDGFDWPSLPAAYLRSIGWADRAPGVAWVASTADVSDKDAMQSVLTGRSLDEIRADVAKLRADLADGVQGTVQPQQESNDER